MLRNGGNNEARPNTHNPRIRSVDGGDRIPARMRKLGAMAIPMGPGNTDKQIRMMIDMKSTVLCSTSSYALLLAEEIAKKKCRG